MKIDCRNLEIKWKIDKLSISSCFFVSSKCGQSQNLTTRAKKENRKEWESEKGVSVKQLIDKR